MKLLAFVVQVAVVSAATVIFSVSTSAITVQEVPGLRSNSWVNDSINILSPKTETEINRVIDQLEAKNRSEIMVITVPETTGYSSPRDFALAWFNHWTIGKKGLDNGVLLMYSRGDDRAGQTPRDRIEIVTDWGLTELFPDQEVVSLIQQDIRPRVNKREYDGAMLTGTQKIAAVLQKYQPKPKSPVSSEPPSIPKKSFLEKATTPFSFQPLNFFLAILYGILYVLLHIVGFVLVLVLLVVFSLQLASPFAFVFWLVALLLQRSAPPSEPDQSPQPTHLPVFFKILNWVVFLYFLLFLLIFAFFGLHALLTAVSPYRVHCNDGKGTVRSGSWSVHSAESFLREKTKEGKRCQREYPQQ